ncbi:MAG: hypothetical protein AB1584_15290 [Pseudomonadota bacterium]
MLSDTLVKVFKKSLQAFAFAFALSPAFARSRLPAKPVFSQKMDSASIGQGLRASLYTVCGTHLFNK